MIIHSQRAWLIGRVRLYNIGAIVVMVKCNATPPIG